MFLLELKCGQCRAHPVFVSQMKLHKTQNCWKSVSHWFSWLWIAPIRGWSNSPKAVGENEERVWW